MVHGNEIKVLFFASLSELINTKELSITVEPRSTIAQLQSLLCQRFPELEEAFSQTTLIAINQTMCELESEIPEQAEVAFFPPMSGG
ncbi:MoaD/ThiS family protein [Pleionea litopenaei]|uniref:Molybdopterin synthase sulfur carrier subunit n=1 Tax=Pleionea litopenaei TaxID=3070815 RepID=A0AA51RQA0_9GAMM|nr:MoaD/ThiS family protein [Pleionea sp. HL-JVS1]WMS85653.1 MoaD/ThiS family protein [Pleionea sp. HL-JVS1]